MKSTISLILILFFRVSYSQISGDWNDGNIIEFKNKNYTNVIDVVKSGEDSFIALFESFDYINGNFVYSSNISKFDVEGKLKTDFGTSGQLIFTLSNYPITRLKSAIVDSSGNIFLLAIVTVNKLEEIQKAAIIKLNPQGLLVEDFGVKGVSQLETSLNYTNGAFDFCIDIDSSIFISGFAIDPSEQYDPFPTVFKLTKNGILDVSFNQTGYRIYKTLNANEISNARVAHLAGGKLKTVSVSSNGDIYVAGSIANLQDNYNFISKLQSNGQLDLSFYGQGFYFPSLDNYQFSSFENSISTNNGKIIFSISQLLQPYDITYGILDETGFRFINQDINSNEDILVDILPIENQVFGLSKTIYTNRYNSLASADENYISKLWIDPNDFEPNINHRIEINTTNKFDVQKAVYISDSKAIIVGGIIYTGNTYHAFLKKESSIFVGLDNTFDSNFLVYPTICLDKLHLETPIIEDKLDVFKISGQKVELSLQVGQNDLSTIESGWYFIKTESGRVAYFFKQ